MGQVKSVCKIVIVIVKTIKSKVRDFMKIMMINVKRMGIIPEISN